MRRIWRRVPAVALWLWLACGSGGDGEGAPADPDACAGETGCNGRCEMGNSYGVGRHCTPGGGQCNGQPAAFCTTDFEQTDQSWCTRPCDPAADVVEQCGENAVCRAQDEAGGGPSGCVPAGCN